MKKSTSNILSAGIVFIIVAVVVFFVSDAYQLFTMQKDPVDITYLEVDEMKKNMHAITDVYAVWDMVITETTENKTYGVTTSSHESSRYYALPYLYSMEQDGEEIATAYTDYFLIVKVDSSDFDKMEQLLDKTNEWYTEWWEAYEADATLPASPELAFTLEGYTRKLDKEENSIMQDYLQAVGYELDDEHPTWESYYDPYYIQCFAHSKDVMYYFVLASVVILMIGVILVIYASIRGKREKEQAAMEYHPTPGYGMTAQNVTFNNSFSSNTTDNTMDSMNASAAQSSEQASGNAGTGFEEFISEYRSEDQ